MTDQLTRILASPNVWIASGLYGMFWLVAYFAEFLELSVFVQCLTFGVSTAVAVAYFSEAWCSFIKKTVDRDDHLIMGIEVAWLGLALRSLFIILWRIGAINGEMPQDGQIQSDWINFFNFMIFSGALLHITAPGTIQGRVPRKNWIWVGAAVGSSLMIFAFLVTFTYARAF